MKQPRWLKEFVAVMFVIATIASIKIFLIVQLLLLHKTLGNELTYWQFFAIDYFYLTWIFLMPVIMGITLGIWIKGGLK